MKDLIKKIVCQLVKLDIIWPIFEKVAKACKYAEASRAEHVYHTEFPEGIVASGPFEGLILPGECHRKGSKLIPKFIGTYEAELTPAINEIISCNPPVLVDIGCAEGYYAVGFATRCPRTQIIAYDTDANARESCNATAAANKVSGRVIIKEHCNSNSLLNLDLPDESIIFSDCEGYELELFTPDVIKHLSKCKFLIETHDLYDPCISKILKERFSSTHTVTTIRSSHDKTDFINNELLKSMSSHMIAHLTHEREANMDWLYCLPT